MGHDVVQLPRDPGALGRDGLPSLLRLLALQLHIVRRQCLLLIAAQPDGQPGRPRTADESQREGDVADIVGRRRVRQQEADNTAGHDETGQRGLDLAGMPAD